MYVATGARSGHTIICTTEEARDHYLHDVARGDAEPLADGFEEREVSDDEYDAVQTENNVYDD